MLLPLGETQRHPGALLRILSLSRGLQSVIVILDEVKKDVKPDLREDKETLEWFRGRSRILKVSGGLAWLSSRGMLHVQVQELSSKV